MKALVGAFNQEKALVGAFSVIVQPVVEPMEYYTALLLGGRAAAGRRHPPRLRHQPHQRAAAGDLGAEPPRLRVLRGQEDRPGQVVAGQHPPTRAVALRKLPGRRNSMRFHNILIIHLIELSHIY